MWANEMLVQKWSIPRLFWGVVGELDKEDDPPSTKDPLKLLTSYFSPSASKESVHIR